jgi:hypothetical protein
MISAFFLNCFLWLVGITALDDSPEDRVQALGKCRDIVIDNHCVKIKFNNAEDAENFASDLRKFINK